MDCHSSGDTGDNAFSSSPKGEEIDAEETITAHLNPTNGEVGKQRCDEAVFGSAAPRGPLAALMASNSDSPTVEASPDMVMLSLKDSSGDYYSNDSNNCGSSSNLETASTLVTDDINHKPSKNFSFIHKVQYKKAKCNESDHRADLSESDNTSVDRTIVDSELPSLPTDNVEIMDHIDAIESYDSYDENLKKMGCQSLEFSEENDMETEPISLSDIRLEENL